MRKLRLAARLKPSHTSDPLGTLARVLRTGDPSARAAVWRTAMSSGTLPLDVLLSLAERRSCRAAGEPRLPTVFVCGPARSGTSLTAQVIIRQFAVTYFSNVVELFPRAPITASRLLARPVHRQSLRLSSFYGKTQSLLEPSDAMAIWDRWFGPDRDSVPERLSPEARDSMRRFFAAWEREWARPLVAKYNRLYLCADLVAQALPRAHFVCLQRDPVFLAQSQLTARRVIVGDESRPYGTVTPEYARLRRPGRPIEDACAYVAADRQVVARTRTRVGSDRFWVLCYESFCRDPSVLLRRLSEEVLGIPFAPLSDADLGLIHVSTSQTVDDATFATLQRTCDQLELVRPGGEYFA